MILTYRTDRLSIDSCLPSPLVGVTDPLVRYEFTHTPDSSGFGAYMSASQTIPCYFPLPGGKKLYGRFVHS